MSMERVAEIGYFVIKYIEELKLDHTVGLADKRPQVWYIPDQYEENDQKEIVGNNDRLATDDELWVLEERVIRRIKNYDDNVMALFS
jgi:hypothetical protein